MFFYWDRWSREHATRHGVSEKEARSVVVRPTPPDPTPVGAGKLQVWGATEAGRLIQVIYLEISPERIRYDELDYLDILDLE